MGSGDEKISATHEKQSRSGAGFPGIPRMVTPPRDVGRFRRVHRSMA
jgi:hypothetical protein